MVDPAELRALIKKEDPEAFILISQTGDGDRRSLLQIQNLVSARKAYSYGEIGSFVGGTLVPHLMDERCTAVVSIDRRPDATPDERSVAMDYSYATTDFMMVLLRDCLPEDVFSKLTTHDCDASDLPPGIRNDIDLWFIDGEHTNTAAFSDFVSIWPLCAKDGIVLFHDANLVSDALVNVERFLTYLGVAFESLCLPDCVFAVFLGDSKDLAAKLRDRSLDKHEYFKSAKEALWQEIVKTRSAPDFKRSGASM